MITTTERVETAAATTRPAQPRTSREDRVRGGGVRLAVSTALVVALLTALVPHLVGAAEPGGAPWWPAAGVALALAARRPARRWWVVAGTLVGALLGARAGGDAGTATLFATAQALQVAVGGSVAGLLTGGRPLRLRRGRDAWRLLAAGLAGTLAGACLQALGGQGLVHHLPAQLLGVMLVAPLLLLPVPGPALRRQRALVLEHAVALLAAAGVSTAVLWTPAPGPWSFLVVVPVLWAAARLGTGRALSCLLVVALVATAGSAGASGQLGAEQATRALQGLLLTAGAVTLVMSLVVRSRDRAVVDARRREELFRRTFDDALLGVALLRLRADGTAVVARVNDRLTSLLGRGVAVGSDWSEQVADEHREGFTAAVVDMVERVREGEAAHWHAELRHGGPDGEGTWLELAAAAWPTAGDPATGEVAAVVQVVDVTQRRLVQRRLREAALHDHLTGLPNRTLLEDRLRHALTGARRSGREVALLYCDLDDFKPVNDTGGHAAGDHVLIGVAERLAAAVRPGDTVARLGGDEFAVVCPDLPDGDAALAVAQRIVESMAQPFEVAGWSFPVGISVGLAVAAPGQDAARVLQEADAAMYEAKGSGKGRVRSAGPRVVDLRARRRSQG
ncbi:diguanylate cyclase domain-containing protein [Kineococcus terrestris]|uniref:diguanylate cyclase domain-containing protein n=1 Tax=Kineococcus terrestris TaxID=2044856 RepID=UPI0034DB78D2